MGADDLVECAASGGTCGDEALVGALPILVSGTTQGADNTATARGRVSSNGAPGEYDLEVSRFECEQVGGPPSINTRMRA